MASEHGDAPLVIVSSAGKPIAVERCSEKSRAKTVEQGELWIVDSTTGRVLPWRHGVGSSACEARDGWWLATVEAAEASDHRQGQVSPDQAGHNPSGADVAPTAEPSARGGAGSTALGDTLTGLAATIAERRRTLPEGSYTTHLFSRGADKIRKKTGEEAVEVILARTSTELVSESADLLYHLMVLLEVEDLSIADVVAELARRHAGD